MSGAWWGSDIPLNLNAMDDYLDQASLQLETHPRPPCLNFPSAEIIIIGDHSWFFSNFKIDTHDNASKKKYEREDEYLH